jgi:hypothetical protein
MRAVLQSLFDGSPIEASMHAIRSPDALTALRAELERGVLAGGRSGSIPPGDYGDNLLLALLALRTKFPRDEAFDKLEVNIAMREARGAARSR